MLLRLALILVCSTLCVSCGTYRLNVGTKQLDDHEEVGSVVLTSGDSIAFGIFGGHYLEASRTIEGSTIEGVARKIPLDSVRVAYVERDVIPASTSAVIPLILLPAALLAFLLIFGKT